MMHKKNPTFQEVVKYLVKRLKECQVPNDVRIPYTETGIMNSARMGLESDWQELVFHKISDTCYAPSVERVD